jgi:hypothetical protein
MSRRWATFAAFLVLAVFAAVPRFLLVERQGLWVDEVFSLALATGHSLEHPAAEARPELGDYVERPAPAPPAEYRRYTAHETPPAGPERVVRANFLSDSNPPLYYLLLWAWTRGFGTSDAALRLFSVACSLACLPLLWAIAREAGGGRAASVISCVLFAAAPAALYYSTEGRMYALVWFLACLLAWATLDLARRGPRASTVLLWVAALAAGLLTHYFFAFVACACAAWLLARRGASPRWFPLAGGLAAGLLVLPWFVRVPESFGRWRVTQGWLDGYPLWWEAAISLPRLAWSFVSTRGHWGNPFWTGLPAIAVFVALALCLLATGKLRPLLSGPRALLGLWALAACLGPAVFDALLGTHTQNVARYALAGLPAAMALAGAAIASLRGPLAALFPALIVLAWFPGIWDVFHNTARNGNSFRETASVLAAWARPGDLVLVHSIPSGVLAVARYLEAGPEVASWVGQLGRRTVPASAEALTAGRRRVALVEVHPVGAPAPEEGWLRRNAVLREERRLHAARLLFFDKSPSPSAARVPDKPAAPARRSAR